MSNVVTKIRCGYPTKRVPDPERMCKHKVMNANLLARFTMSKGLVTKVLQLHATKGWRVY